MPQLPASGTPGFSLVEMSLVLLLIGLLLTLGTACWDMLAASRRLAQTRGELYSIKQCLVRHAASGGRYPTYLSSTDCTRNQDTDLGVCLCRTGARDVWNNAFLYLEGRDSGGSSLAGQAVADLAYLEIDAARVAEASTAIDHDGHNYARVAFVLLSLGPNGEADGDYDAFASGTTARTMQQTADFSAGGEDFDDMYLIVTARELRAALRE